MQALTTRVGFHLAAHQATICGQFNGGFMSDNITNVTDASFEEDVLKAEGVVLFNNWANGVGRAK